MIGTWKEQAVFRAPQVTWEEVGPWKVAVDGLRPHWMVTDRRGQKILSLLDGRLSFGEVVRRYAEEERLDPAKAWLHVSHFLRETAREGFASLNGSSPEDYLGRAFYRKPEGLQELWIHLNNSCNLQCAHCLVSSGPKGEKGLPPEKVSALVEEAFALGAHRFFITGGEPFLREDLPDLIESIAVRRKKELVLLTNGLLLTEKRLEFLKPLAKTGLLQLQISLDGASPETNDPIRGKGTFEKIIQALRRVRDIGFDPTVTVALTRRNVKDLSAMVELLAKENLRRLHLLYLHRRGRSLDMGDVFPSNEEILAAIRAARALAAERGVTIDNLESLKIRLDAPAGTKFDLSNAGWESLCVSYDGWVYPSAAFSGEKELACGSVFEQSLKEIYENSPVLKELRTATVQAKNQCKACHLRFVCGGGDVEHGYFYSKGLTGKGSFLGWDPYCSLYQGLIYDALYAAAAERAKLENRKSGFDRPVVLRSRGAGGVLCGVEEEENKKGLTASPVRFSHSTCVLSVDLQDAARLKVREFYSEAGEKPKEELCCPLRPSEEDLAHIPKEVVERFYGCGSPVQDAALREGETFVDLGSGAGIDCFIAAKRVGPKGRVIGVDMTPSMRKVALESAPKVAEKLGYNVTEFREGFLENVPVEDSIADVVTSNCVINLSPDKPKVFSEMWRILKDHGRAVVADIVSEESVPPHLRVNVHLWGECLSGALTEQEFLDAMERAGFYGLQVLKKIYWKEVEGYKFYSITVRGYKYKKKEGCVYIGQRAVYLGPGKAFVDEEGHLFPRGEAVEVCTDTAAKLSRAPYAGTFAVLESGEGRPSFAADFTNEGCCGAGGCC